MVTRRGCYTSTTGGTGFSILEPGETVAPESEAWRAVSMTVPEERAVGGLITAGMTVDVFMSAQVNVPQDLTEGRYYTDKSTKITYQNMLVVAPRVNGYVVKATLAGPRRSPISSRRAMPSSA